jgi:hypothetical protein
MANAQVNADFLENGRGGFYLIHAGYKFSVCTREKERTYWRCIDRQYPARIVTIDKILVSFLKVHNHDADFIGLAAQSFMNGVKKRCT